MTVGLHLTALAVAIIYYGWRDGYVAWRQRSRVLRERVAYMLWTAAQQMA